MSFLNCCGGNRKGRNDDTTPLLPQYEDDTSRQRALHQKLHSYQMFRALGKGFMPSTEQTIVNLRTFLASDLLNPNNKDLSESGRLLVRHCRNWLKVFIELLRNKNNKDQIQDFIWYLSKSRVGIDIEDIQNQAARLKSKANSNATYESFKTVGSLLLTNQDFRIFVNDLSIMGRQVLSDSAFSLSKAAETTGKKLEASSEDKAKLDGSGADEGDLPSREEVKQEAQETAQVLGDAIVKVSQDTAESAKGQFQGKQQNTLIYRLKQTVLNLRKRTDYQDSVSMISKMIQNYAVAYSRVAEQTIATAQQDVVANPEMNRAGRNFWDLCSNFGDKDAWEQLEKDFNKLFEHAQKDPELEKFMQDIGNEVQKMLTDPDFFDHAGEKIDALKQKAQGIGNDTSFKDDFAKFFQQAQATIVSVTEDQDVQSLMNETMSMYKILSPPEQITNPDLVTDSINIFLPLFMQTIQYVPIPRIEISVPEMDLLLENLILEPGRTVNNTSFLPYRLLVSTKNDLEVRKAHSRKTVSSVKSLMTISINGLSISAKDIGFWIRAHSGIFTFADEGLVDFALDQRGIDISLDLEIGREKLEEILTLRAVRVHIHKLEYNLQKSKLSWLAWLFKPLLKQLVRRVLEKQIAQAIADGLRAANRELLFARERLRATRISDPQDLVTFVKAIAARLSPEDNPDLYSRVGVDAPKKGVFKNVYAPGSIVKVWHEEAMEAETRLYEGEDHQASWRNEVFDAVVQ